MEGIQITIYLILLMGIVFLISYLMEIYKKELRKDKATKWENYIIGFILSLGGVYLLKFMGVLKPILALIGAYPFCDIILYTIIFYIMQMQLSLRVIKKITLHFIKNFLERKGVDPEEIKRLINN